MFQWSVFTSLADKNFTEAYLLLDAWTRMCQANVLANSSDALWYVCFFPLKVITELGNSESKTAAVLHSGPLKPDERHASQLKKKELYSNFGMEPDTDHYPILLWWSPLTGETGRLGQCGEDVCFFTINKSYQHSQMTRAFLFYGKELFLSKGETFPPIIFS